MVNTLYWSVCIETMDSGLVWNWPKYTLSTQKGPFLDLSDLIVNFLDSAENDVLKRHKSKDEN